MCGDGMHDPINDEFGDPKQYDGQERGEYPRHQPKNHNRGARVPHDLEHSWDVAERGDALLPPRPQTFPFRHASILPFLLVHSGKTDEVVRIPKNWASALVSIYLHERCPNRI